MFPLPGLVELASLPRRRKAASDMYTQQAGANDPVRNIFLTQSRPLTRSLTAVLSKPVAIQKAGRSVLSAGWSTSSCSRRTDWYPRRLVREARRRGISCRRSRARKYFRQEGPILVRTIPTSHPKQPRSCTYRQSNERAQARCQRRPLVKRERSSHNVVPIFLTSRRHAYISFRTVSAGICFCCTSCAETLGVCHR